MAFCVTKAGAVPQDFGRTTSNRIALVVATVLDFVAHEFEAALHEHFFRCAACGEFGGFLCDIGMMPVDVFAGGEIGVH